MLFLIYLNCAANTAYSSPPSALTVHFKCIPSTTRSISLPPLNLFYSPSSSLPFCIGRNPMHVVFERGRLVHSHSMLQELVQRKEGVKRDIFFTFLIRPLCLLIIIGKTRRKLSLKKCLYLLDCYFFTDLSLYF